MDAGVILVKTPAEGLAMVEDGTAAALAGDRIVLAQLAKRARDPDKLQMLEQDYSYEPYAIALRGATPTCASRSIRAGAALPSVATSRK